MKKIYIAPSEKVVKISTRNPFMEISANNELGNGVQLTKEMEFGEDVSSDITTKNLWDNEW